jgi:hypothetical protein
MKMNNIQNNTVCDGKFAVLDKYDFMPWVMPPKTRQSSMKTANMNSEKSYNDANAWLCLERPECIRNLSF